MKFIHTADWQVGMTRHFLSGEAQPRFSGARLDAVRRIGELAVEEGCEFVVVCGDVFESNQIDRQVLVRTLDVMASTPQVTFYLLPGNHDPLDAASIYQSGKFLEHTPANVVVLKNSQPVPVAEGIELVAAPWTSKRPLCDLVDQACALREPTEALRIVAGHGALDTRSPDADNPAIIVLARLEERIEAGRDPLRRARRPPLHNEGGHQQPRLVLRRARTHRLQRDRSGQCAGGGTRPRPAAGQEPPSWHVGF